MRKFYALSVGILLLIVCTNARAGSGGERSSTVVFQQQGVSGKVSDEGDFPLPGVNVVIKGSTAGTVTDSDGKFSFSEIPADAVLVFSFIGYGTQEVSVNSRTEVNIVMQPDLASLGEVVVTALGIKKETRKVGFAAQNVEVSQLQLNRTVNVMESMQGKIAGLDISAPAAGAGASTKIRLRGQAAFGAAGVSNSPLIVINGLPMNQDALGADGPANLRDRGDALQNINPDDIESITVLKGSTGAALYGSRAANGAILITTKSGKRGQGQGLGVEYTTNYMASEVLDYTDLQTEYGSGTWSPVTSRGVRPTTAADATNAGAFGWGEPLDGKLTMNFDGLMRPYEAYPNRVKDFYRTGSTFTNTVAVSSGNDRGGFRASFSHVKAKGITPNNEYAKKIANLGLNYNLTDKLKLSVNANYAREDNENPPAVGAQGTGEANFIYRMANSIPLSAYQESALADNGISERQTSGFQTTLINPYFSMSRQFYNSVKNRLLSTTSLRYDFTDWLYLQGRYNYDYSTIHNEFNTPTGLGNSSPLNSTSTGYNGAFQVEETRGTEVNADFLLGVKKEFGDFSIDVSAGGNTYRTTYAYNTQSVTDLVTLGIYALGNGLTQNQNVYRIDRRRVNSLYATAELGYKNMLYLTATDRQDWFSVINTSDKGKNYPSLAGSFIFSEVLPDQGFLSYGKLRGSWAQVGSINGVTFAEGLLNYTVLTNPFPTNTGGTQKLGNIDNSTNNAPNPNLKPFIVTETEVGMELKFFNNRVNLDVAAYKKTSTDQVLRVLISNATGYTGTKQNIGSMENKGLELSLEIIPVQNDNFKWSTGFNGAHNQTKVLSLSPENNRFVQTDFGGTGTSNEFIGQLVYEVGLPLNQLSAKTYQRDANGNILVNDNGQLLPSDKPVNYGSALPTWTGAWNNTFSYKKISLFLQVDFKTGGKILSGSNLNWLRQGLSKQSLVGRDGITSAVFPAVVKSTGEPYAGVVNPQTFYTDYRTQQIGDPFVYNNDFVKLRNVTLSYDLTSFIQARTKAIKGLTLSAACRNVWLIYKDIDNLDPEATASSGDNRVGYEGTSLPTTRNYSINLNVRF